MGQAKAKEVEQGFDSWEESQSSSSRKDFRDNSKRESFSWIPQAILSSIGITSLALLFSWIQEFVPGAYLSLSSYYLLGLLLGSFSRLCFPLNQSRLFRAALPCLLIFGLLPIVWSLKLFSIEPAVASAFSVIFGFFLVSSLSFPVGGGVAYSLSLLVAVICSLPLAFRLYSFSGIQGLTIVSSLSLLCLCLFQVKKESRRVLSAFGFTLFSSLSLFLVTLFSSQSIGFLNKESLPSATEESLADLKLLPDSQGRTLFVSDLSFESEGINNITGDHLSLIHI